MNNGKLGELDRIMVAIEDQAEKWLPLQLIADQLETDKGPYLDSLQNSLARVPAGTKDAQQPSEAYLKRAAQGSDEYREYIKQMCLAKNAALREKLRYENLIRWWENKRTQSVTERIIVAKGIFERGGKS